MTEPECETCGGTTELVKEPHDWWFGSGVNAESFPCPDCCQGDEP